MDRNQFDRLSRVVAAGSRRDALRLLVAGVVAGAVGVDGVSARKKRRGGTQTAQALQCTRLCVNCRGKRPGPGTNLTGCDFDDADLVLPTAVESLQDRAVRFDRAVDVLERERILRHATGMVVLDLRLRKRRRMDGRRERPGQARMGA